MMLKIKGWLVLPEGSIKATAVSSIVRYYVENEERTHCVVYTHKSTSSFDIGYKFATKTPYGEVMELFRIALAELEEGDTNDES